MKLTAILNINVPRPKDMDKKTFTALRGNIKAALLANIADDLDTFGSTICVDDEETMEWIDLDYTVSVKAVTVVKA